MGFEFLDFEIKDSDFWRIIKTAKLIKLGAVKTLF